MKLRVQETGKQRIFPGHDSGLLGRFLKWQTRLSAVNLKQNYKPPRWRDTILPYEHFQVEMPS